jgi:hypothetical protein
MDITERDGLAVYRRGFGPEVVIPPYPHASTHRPMAQDRLADLLVAARFAVVSFDPPGAYQSSRPMRGDMAETGSGGSECAPSRSQHARRSTTNDSANIGWTYDASST